uniref:Glutamate synthase domain-containing protein n=1 Tax=Rhizochromulina marina TaxID=1034831 RepID=A0A7S2R8T6_9STRA
MFGLDNMLRLGFGPGRARSQLVLRGLASSPPGSNERRIPSMPGGSEAGFPDFVEHWTPQVFKAVGGGLILGTMATSAMAGPVPGAMLGAVTALYWKVGLDDMRQTSQTIRRNFPVLGNARYVLESLRPEIRQYFVESETEAMPFDRPHRSLAYQRAKNSIDTQPFGTKRDVYAEGYEFVTHSMWPKVATEEDSRVIVGGDECRQPYSASRLNISAMSYGALSDNAILALNTGARKGNFYHNTGEGGISRFHLDPGADVVWNIGTGYFGCGQGSTHREFDPVMFRDNATRPTVKMIEIKLSQGAKPAHGGLLPMAKITPMIAEARGLEYPATADCNSPPNHSAFSNSTELCHFIARLREGSDGKPIGIKICVGKPEEFSELLQAMLQTNISPDFITIDGAEGGTGAAPAEFTNSVGMPMHEGLTLAHSMMVGAGIRHKIKLIAAGKVLTGFSMVKTIALGADIMNSARAMMFALGCIQALKCNTNKCPTGITTQDPVLMSGLVVPDKAERVYRFHKKTLHAALEITGALGYNNPGDIKATDVIRRTPAGLRTFEEIYSHVGVEPGALLKGRGPHRLQLAWDLDDGFVQTSYVT